MSLLLTGLSMATAATTADLHSDLGLRLEHHR
jgi:hypothetical protein